MISEFGKALLFLIGGCIFVAGGMLTASLISPSRPNPEKLTSYECGEDPIGTSWVQFNIRFYVMGLIFLIFDVEILLLFPWALVFSDSETITNVPFWGIFTFTEAMIFIFVLALGLIYIWVQGDIDWVRPRPLVPVSDSPVPLSEYEAYNQTILSNAKPNDTIQAS